MKLSLSVRVAEPPKQKDVAALPIEQLAPRAKELGFDGLSMRASVVSVDSPPERVAAVRELLDGLDLSVSTVCGDIPLASNSTEAVTAIRNIGPYLDLAERLGAPMVRVMMQSEEDIPHAQRASDEAAERGHKLVHLTHWGTLFETVGDALAAIDAVDRPNFGAAFEPANLFACGGAYGPGALERLLPHLFNVFLSNVRLDPDSPVSFPSRRRGMVTLRYVPVDDSSAIRMQPLIAALKRLGYDGWITVHQPSGDGEDIDAAMRRASAFFGPLVRD